MLRKYKVTMIGNQPVIKEAESPTKLMDSFIGKGRYTRVEHRYQANCIIETYNSKRPVETFFAILPQSSNIQVNNVYQSMAKLSCDLYSKYTGEKVTQIPTESQAASWLVADIETILVNKGVDLIHEIREYIDKAPYGREINANFIDWVSIQRVVAIRSNFANALKNVKTGSELSGILGYGFTKADLKQLAKLHKSNRYRAKIESLLTDCNFHKECCDFCSGRYEPYL